MINKHPQPVDDCPCFEDSIAFVSSVLGVLIGEWHIVQFGLLKNKNSSGGGEWNNWSIWLGFAALKLFFGESLSVYCCRLSTNSHSLSRHSYDLHLASCRQGSFSRDPPTNIPFRSAHFHVAESPLLHTRH